MHSKQRKYFRYSHAQVTKAEADAHRQSSWQREEQQGVSRARNVAAQHRMRVCTECGNYSSARGGGGGGQGRYSSYTKE